MVSQGSKLLSFSSLLTDIQSFRKLVIYPHFKTNRLPQSGVIFSSFHFI